MRNDASFATVLLASRLCDEDVEPLKAAEYWKLCNQLGEPDVLRGQSEADLARVHGPELAARIVRLLDRATAMAFEIDGLEQSGIKTLTPFDDRYPERLRSRLGSKAPPLLHAAGDLSLLQQPGIGVVGSRDVTEDGETAAEDAARQAAERKLVLVSGGARGVDRKAMAAAFEAGGAVVGVLAESLRRRLKAPDVRQAIHDERAVMCTPYSPDAPFSVGNAMGRNKIIYALSQITLVVASEVGSGGTWSGAVEALKAGSGRVGAWRGPGGGPGNEKLVEKGAIAVSSVDDLVEAMRSPDPAPAVAAVQPSLFEPAG